jgi:hypothetical protein
MNRSAMVNRLIRLLPLSYEWYVDTTYLADNTGIIQVGSTGIQSFFFGLSDIKNCCL